VMRRPPKGGNRLLAALPSADLALLSPHLKEVSLEQDAVVVRSGDRREHVIFPTAGPFPSCSTCRTEQRLQPR
jgi:hypothetical protein